MRLAFLLLTCALALVGCPKPSAPATDAGLPLVDAAPSSMPPAASVSAAASASVATGPPAPPSVETAPAVSLPPRTDIPSTIELGKTLVVSGILGAAEERSAPESISCTYPVKLDRPLRVVDEHGETVVDGRGLGAHPVIGQAKRICLWAWKGWTTNDGWMIPWGSHVIVRGTLSPPMVRQHPAALLMFDTELLSAAPGSAVVPPEKLPDGDTVAFIRAHEPGTGSAKLDVAFLYYGLAAEKLARDRGEPLPPGKSWYLVDESTQLRSWPIRHGTSWPVRLQRSSGGHGWNPVDDGELVSERPYLITIAKGAVEQFRQISFDPH